MLNRDLTKGLADPMAATFLRDLVHVVVGQVVLIANSCVGSESLSWPNGLN